MGAPVGNKNAVNGREFRSALRRALAHKYGDVQSGLLAVAQKLVDAATERDDLAACREIADREDGKPAQSIGGDPEGVPVNHSMTVTFVKPE